jgi:hypothetical protein
MSPTRLLVLELLHMSPASLAMVAPPAIASSLPIHTSAKIDLEEFLDILKSLIREPSVVGNEESFFRVLRRELEEVGVQVQYFHGVLVAQGDLPHDPG